MTAAAYNQDGRWDVPPYVWPAVLGMSLAIHASVLIYGLPDWSWLQNLGPEPTETEVVLESGGLEFETVTAVESVAVEEPQPAAVPAVDPVKTPFPQPSTSNAVPVQPVTKEILSPAEADVVQPDSPSPSTAEQVQTAPATRIEAKEAVTGDARPVERVESAPIKTVSAASETVIAKETPSANVVVAVPNAADNVVTGRPTMPKTSIVVAAAPDEGVVVKSGDQEVLPVIVAVKPAQVSGKVTVAKKAQAQKVQGDEAISALPLAVEVVAVTGNQPTIQVPMQAAPVTAPVPDSSNADDPATPVLPAATEVVAAVKPDSLNAPVNSEQTGNAQAVRPVEQQLASLRPTEEGLPAIAPARPETAPVPSVTLPSDPADNVPPVEVASIDPLAKVTSYVAGYDAGECAHLSVLSAGADNATVTAYGAGIAPFALFDQRFAADHGYEAKVEVRLVTRRQCALLDALGLSNGLEAAGLVELDKTIVRSGTPVSGVIQRDLPVDRIAQAEQAGLQLNGKGPPELYLIDDAGQIHDGRDHILPATNAVTAGGWRFAVPVTLLSSEDSETALILAVWNRPKSKQPAKFGTMPADSIAAVLAAPGVYSLSAFKVAR